MSELPATIFVVSGPIELVRDEFFRRSKPRAIAWSCCFVAEPKIDELLALDVQTRLEIVQELWDSIVKDAKAGAELPISQRERETLDERLREDDEDPGAAIS
jgi:putative addiction module component (TIGR02574 family)